MNIGEILSEVDEVWAPNSVTTARKCAWLTQEQWQLYRKVSFPNVVDKIQAVKDLAVYPLPTNCQPDRIQHVILLDAQDLTIEYDNKARGQNASGFWFDIAMDNILILSKAPTDTDSWLMLFYTPRPAAFTETNLTATPAIPADYHEYFLKRLAARCAKANYASGGAERDLNMANNYEMEAVEILRAMLQDFRPDATAGFRVEVRW